MTGGSSDGCREPNLNPIVTLVHVTMTALLMHDGGWTGPKTGDRLDGGADVCGYVHWPARQLEWVLGFAPTFGLVSVDHQTFARPRVSPGQGT